MTTLALAILTIGTLYCVGSFRITGVLWQHIPTIAFFATIISAIFK